MLSFKCVYLLFWLAVASEAQIPSLGFCPDYLPMTDFKMERFLGKWYESERYFTFSEVASRCVVTDYAKAPSGRIFVSNEVTNRLTGVKRVINGNLQLIGKGNEAKIQVKYTTTPIPTESTLLVLDTDYDNFAVVWSCTGLGPIHAQNAWLMTRERLPTGPTLQEAYGILDKFKISRTFFVKTDQEGCAVAASDINAANGITSISTIVDATGTDQRNAEVVKSGLTIDEPKPLLLENPKIEKPADDNKASIKIEKPADDNKAPIKIEKVPIPLKVPTKIEENKIPNDPAEIEKPVVKPEKLSLEKNKILECHEKKQDPIKPEKLTPQENTVAPLVPTKAETQKV